MAAALDTLTAAERGLGKFKREFEESARTAAPQPAHPATSRPPPTHRPHMIPAMDPHPHTQRPARHSDPN